jgi:SAM-dependent methyltransferase
MAMEFLDRYLDYLDALACKIGIAKVADWETVRAGPSAKLYAGKLRRSLPQFRSHFGLTPFFPSMRNIPHDICSPIPLLDASVDVYQSEDVFEHVPYEKLPAVFDDIYRVLKPGSLFRLSVPDYGSDLHRERSLRDGDGNIVFDPGGGGGFENGEVVGGGHVWFPTYENVQDLFANSRFSREGKVRVLHATKGPNDFILEPIDYSLGYVQRTPDNDHRARAPRRPLSIVVDAYKAG